jgi:hypothetical protein
MHARIDHLLSLRDGVPTDAWVAGHVEQCSSCAAQLRRLEDMRSQLQGLGQLDAPESSWEAIQARMRSSRVPRWQRRVAYAAAAASLFVLGIVATVIIRQQGITPPQEMIATGDVPWIAPPPKVNELVEQSQHLDHLLQALPERPRVERVSTAATIDTIEQRIQWLDFQLSYAHEQGLNELQAQRLWSERVELMDSLVKIRSAESGGISF